MKIDHIGIAVPEIQAAIEQYQSLGFEFLRRESVPDQKVSTAFFAAGDSHIELLEATEEDSPVGKFMARRGPGIHHICVQVEDLDATLEQYKKDGLRLINETPVIGAGGFRVAFVHPKSTSGVLLELLELKK